MDIFYILASSEFCVVEALTAKAGDENPFLAHSTAGWQHSTRRPNYERYQHSS